MTPGRLEVDTATGKVTGPASLKYNDPFPARNGSWGSGGMMGLVLHTMVGQLDSCVSWFNDQASQASAHFGVAQDGEIHMFGPLGKGWIAWAEAAGNPAWYSVETADNGDPANPLTPEQITAVAQILELTSRFAGFPLVVTDLVARKGFGRHSMGGVSWGNHPGCPGPVRANQRPVIIALALDIRAGHVNARHWLSLGAWSLAREAAAHRTTPDQMLALAAAAGHSYRPAMEQYVERGDWSARLPVSVELFAPLT